jgi:hypothetical protein
MSEEFRKANYYFDRAIALMEKKHYKEAEVFYKIAMEIYNEHFADNKEILTTQENPF